MNPTLPERVIELACAIQQISAPTYQEARRAAYVQQRFLAEGLTQVSTDVIGNVYACIPGKVSDSPLVVSAHLDTVFPAETDLSLRWSSDKIVGPGIGDNSLGVAALFSLAWEFSEPPRDIWLVANVCEEGLGNLRGIQAVIDRFGREALAYIVIEGMSLGQVYHVGLGVQRYRVSVSTPGGHAWVDHGKPSAVHILAELAVRLAQLPLPDKPRTSLNIGVIKGGTSINTIAAAAMLELDLRSEGSQTLKDLSMQVETIVKSAQQEVESSVRMDAEVIGQRPAGKIAADHELVQLAVRCMQEQGLKANLNTGSTDANCPLSYGIPAICVGVTTGGGSHTTDEFINLPPISQGLGQIISLVKQSCGLSP